MTQQAYEQTVKQQEHIEDLLTKESLYVWINSLGLVGFGQKCYQNLHLSTKEMYLKEHGLPLTSEIKGL